MKQEIKVLKSLNLKFLCFSGGKSPVRKETLKKAHHRGCLVIDYAKKAKEIEGDMKARENV